MEFRELGRTGLRVSAVGFGTSPLGNMFGAADHDIEFVPLDPVMTDSYAELVRLRDEGKCRFIGMTGYPIAMLRRVISETDVDVVLSYAHATLLDGCLRTSLVPLAADAGVGVIDASAVAFGLLTSSGSSVGIDHPANERIRAAATRAVAVAERHGVDISFLANQYAIQRSGCASTLVGTTRPEHVQEAVRAVAEPIDEALLDEVLAAVADVRGTCWSIGLPENT